MVEYQSTKSEPTQDVAAKKPAENGSFQDQRPSTKKKLGLQAGIVQREEKVAAAGDAGNEDDSKLSVSIEQDMILLQGQLSMSAKFKGLFGAESTFSQLLKKVNEYQAAKTEEEKNALKPSIIATGEAWLSKNSERQDATDDLKKASITRIVAALKKPEQKVELGSMSDKVTFSAKVKEAVTGTSSTFQLLEKAYLEFQKEAVGQIDSFDKVFEMLQKGQAVHGLTEQWKAKHAPGGKTDEPEKLAIINGINNHLGLVSIHTRLNGYFDAKLSKIDVAQATNSSFVAQEVKITVPISDGLAIGTLTNTTISQDKFDFDELTLQYQGELCPISGVKISDPSLTLKNLKDHYEASAEGKLDVALSPKYGLNSLEAKGELAGTYDFGSSSFKELSVKGGEIKLGFLDNRLVVDVKGVNAEGGKLKAEKGSLTVNVSGTEVKGTMNAISYSKEEGISFESASISSTTELNFSDILKVSKPTLGIKRTESGWEVTGEGHVESKADIPFVKLDDLSGDLAITYDLASKSFTRTTVDKGAIKATLFDLFSLEASEIGYANNTLTVGSATGKVTKSNFLGQSSPTVTAKGLAFSKSGADWSSVEVALGKELKMGDFTFQLPNALLEKKTDNVALHLNNATANFKKDDFEAEGKASFEWNSKKASLIPEITSGALAMTANKKMNLPGDYLPFGWPLSFGFSTIIVPAPVPISVGVELGLKGGIEGFKIDASLVYANNEFEFKGSLGTPVSLTLALKISAGVGTPLILYLGGFIEAAATAKGTTELGLEGKASKKDKGYELDELLATYGVNANFIASLSGGFEAKALVFFKKELYRFNIKEWNLGSSSISGSHELIKGDKKQKSASKLFNTTTGDRSDIPPAEPDYSNLEYGPALERLYSILESAGVDTSITTINKLRMDGKTSETEVSADTNTVKKNVKQVLVDLYSSSESHELEGRLKHYNDKIARIQSGEESRWFTSQATLLERNIKKRDDVKFKVTQIRNTYAASLTIYKSLDALIKPNTHVTLASVEGKILAYQDQLAEVGDLSKQLQQLKLEMEEFMLEQE